MRNLTYKSIDVMKKSKDVITAQLPLQEKQNLVQCLASAGANTIAISVPMDDSGVFPLRGIKVQPKKIEAETQEWCDVIHQQGLKVMHRGTFCGVENIYNMPFDQNTPMGNAASAQRDGSGTWCGRWFRYLYNHVSTHVVQGDIFAPIPEGATHAFDGHWFAKSRDAYAQMFIDFHAILNAYAASRGISLVFMMQENFSEVASGWMPRNVLQDAGVVALDYYGQRTNDQANKPADYVNDWTKLWQGRDSRAPFGNNNASGLNQFWGEWGDMASALPPIASDKDRCDALVALYKALRDHLVPPAGHLVGFNYWGGWEGQDTSIVDKVGDKYFLNFRGQILQTFFMNNGGVW